MMARRGQDRAKTTDAAKDAVAEILASMPKASQGALLARVTALAEQDIDQLAADVLHAQLLKLHAQLAADFEAARFLVQEHPIRRPIVTEDNLPVLKVVHEKIRVARARLTPLNTLDGAGTGALRDALKQLQDVYRSLEYSIEWEKFSDAIDALKAAEKRAETEGNKAKAQAEQRDAQRGVDEVQRRVKTWLIQARAAGEGDGKVKCVVITPDGGQAVTGHAGALDSKQVHVALQKLLDTVRPTAPWDKTNCAEVDGLNRLLFTQYPAITQWQEIPAGMTLRAYMYEGGAWKNRRPCENCSQWMAKIKATKEAVVG